MTEDLDEIKELARTMRATHQEKGYFIDLSSSRKAPSIFRKGTQSLFLFMEFLNFAY